MAEGENGTFPAGWTPFEDPGFVAHVGPVFWREAGGGKDYAFRTVDKHVNLVGIVHGGMLVTFADRALSICARDATGGAVCVTIEMNVQFVGAAKIGDVIETTPQIVRQTSSLIFVRTVLTCEDRPIAAISGIWKVLREKQKG